MIPWILFTVLIIWCLGKRFSANGKVEGQPLGMPRGTVRALITILIITFPLIYISKGKEIPSLITSAIFILVAFYFQSRKSDKDKLKRIVKDIQRPEKIKEKEEAPLYLPKYTVRIILVITLISILIINTLGPNVPFETTNTLTDLLLIIGLFTVGTIFRSLGFSKTKRKIHEKVTNINNFQSLSQDKIIEILKDEELSWWKKEGKNILSVFVLIAVIISLLCYTIEWDYIILTLPFYLVSLRESLLLTVNIYYGFRD
ncbi:MAG: hypothetical protein ACTSQJ_18665 [Promethearchaeota archaeon]